MAAKVTLKAGREKPLRNRHPWIFSGAVAQVEGNPADGDIVPVYSKSDEFMAWGFINRKSQIMLRVLSFADEPVDDAFLKRRIEQAIALRRTILSESTDACRLVHSSGDELPGLIVDQYDRTLVIQITSLGMQRWKPVIVDILNSLMAPQAIVERSDSPSPEEGLERNRAVLSGELTGPIMIKENGFRFEVDALRGQKTGFFLDQRENRRMIGDHTVAGQRMLNCFAYTGGFSIYGAAAGAVTTSVEMSSPALEAARQNFVHNGFDPEAHRFIGENVFDFLREPGEPYDIIVLDPPSFVKKKKDVNKGARGYKDINRLAIGAIKPGGLLLTCSCSGYVNWDLFQKIVFSAAAEAKRPTQIIARMGQPADHPLNIYLPEAEYLKTFLLRIG